MRSGERAFDEPVWYQPHERHGDAEGDAEPPVGEGQADAQAVHREGGLALMSVPIAAASKELSPSLNASSLCLDMVYPGRPDEGVSATRRRLLIWLLRTATGQARWAPGSG